LNACSDSCIPFTAFISQSFLSKKSSLGNPKNSMMKGLISFIIPVDASSNINPSLEVSNNLRYFISEDLIACCASSCWVIS